MKRQTGAIALLLAGILMVSAAVTYVTMPTPNEETDEFRVVAGFYPMYTAALAVVGDTEGVSVSCLTTPTAGCMHEYQLSPDERAVLNSADVLVLSGGGAESFLDNALTTLPSLPVLTTSGEVAWLNDCTEHDHEHDHDHSSTSVNEHCWVSPVQYAKQIEALRDGLCALDPDRAEQYRRNAAAYLQKIHAVADRAAALPLSQVAQTTVLFHDSMAYVADWLGLPVSAVLTVGEESGVSAADLADAADRIRSKRVLFLHDSQYPADTYFLHLATADSKSVSWNIAVMPMNGVRDADTWLAAMEQNLNALQEVLG